MKSTITVSTRSAVFWGSIAPLCALLIGIWLGKQTLASIPGFNPPQKACTMEAKLCPDGSAVGRSGPNCEFAPCPDGAQ